MMRHWSLLDIRLQVQVRLNASHHGGKAAESKTLHRSLACPSLMFSREPSIADAACCDHAYTLASHSFYVRKPPRSFSPTVKEFYSLVLTVKVA
jgi:hypothetical protein